MKGLAIVDRGLEDIAKREISEKAKAECKTEETRVLFNFSKGEDLCRLAYTCQSVRRILLVLKEIKVDDKIEENVSELEKEFGSKELEILSSKKVSVECERNGMHSFTSVDYAQAFSKILHENKIELTRDNQDISIFIYIYENKGYVCIDYSGKDLSKRNYRIFTKSNTLKGTLAYALVRLADYKPGETILDPMCSSGIIPIEAALFALKKPVNFYKKEFPFMKINPGFEKVFDVEDKKSKDKTKGIFAFDKLLSNIHSAKKNAKIAGVEKNINFSKVDLEWLDTKFEKESVDKIVVKLPAESKKVEEKQVQKIYEEFFYQAEFILRKKGLIVVCSLKQELLAETAKKKGFKIRKGKTIFSGQQQYFVNIFEKN